MTHQIAMGTPLMMRMAQKKAKPTTTKLLFILNYWICFFAKQCSELLELTDDLDWAMAGFYTRSPPFLLGTGSIWHVQYDKMARFEPYSVVIMATKCCWNIGQVNYCLAFSFLRIANTRVENLRDCTASLDGLLCDVNIISQFLHYPCLSIVTKNWNPREKLQCFAVFEFMLNG